MNLTVKSVCWILHVSKCNVCVHDTSAEKLFLDKFPPSLSRDKTFPIRTFFLTYLDLKRFLPSPSSSWVRRPLLCINFCHLFVYLVVATSVPWLRQGRCQMGHGTFFYFFSWRGGDGTFDFWNAQTEDVWFIIMNVSHTKYEWKEQKTWL